MGTLGAFLGVLLFHKLFQAVSQTRSTTKHNSVTTNV